MTKITRGQSGISRNCLMIELAEENQRLKWIIERQKMVIERLEREQDKGNDEAATTTLTQ